MTARALLLLLIAASAGAVLWGWRQSPDEGVLGTNREAQRAPDRGPELVLDTLPEVPEGGQREAIDKADHHADEGAIHGTRAAETSAAPRSIATEGTPGALEFRVKTWPRDRSPGGHAFALLHIRAAADGPEEQILATGRTDARGKARLYLAPGRARGIDRRRDFVLRVTEPGYLASDAEVSWFGSTDSGQGRVRIVPVAGFDRLVRAVNAAGAPVEAEFTVEGHRAQRQVERCGRAPFQILSPGLARVAVVSARHSTLIVEHPEHGRGQISHKELYGQGPRDEPHVIVLHRASEISGRLRGAQGAPLAGVPLQIQRVTSRDEPAPEPRNRAATTKARVSTDADGWFEVRYLVAGSYRVRAAHDLESFATVEAFPMSPPVDLRLNRLWFEIHLDEPGPTESTVGQSLQVNPTASRKALPEKPPGRWLYLLEPGETYTFTVTEMRSVTEPTPPEEFRTARTTVEVPWAPTSAALEIARPDDSHPWEN